jgi:hypothetical protein
MSTAIPYKCETLASMLLVCLTGLACSTGEALDDELVHETDETSITPSTELPSDTPRSQMHRSDVKATVEPPGGNAWGIWHPSVYCNDGTYAYGYELRVETPIGSGDDTALNSVRLFCEAPGGGSKNDITPLDGIWGMWFDPSYCPVGGEVLIGVKLNSEPPVGEDKDDTSANDVMFSCSESGDLDNPAGGPWGKGWGLWAWCPHNTAICGLSILFEQPQGSGDDTAMNSIRVHCCSL